MYEFSKVETTGSDPIKIDNVIPEMIPIKEAAKRTGLSYYYLRNACLRGEIVHIRAGAKILINFNRLCDFLDSAGVVNNE